jgi:hypothetical protein
MLEPTLWAGNQRLLFFSATIAAVAAIQVKIKQLFNLWQVKAGQGQVKIKLFQLG